MTANQVAYLSMVENQRHNLAGEVETNRSNLARETETARNNLAINFETARSNKAKEKETKRSNKAHEKLQGQVNKETKRSNKANEKIKRQANKIQQNANAETQRHNLATETETARSNRANEQNYVYNVDKSTDATKYAADVGAQGRVTAAAISADASKYATDVNRAIAAYHESQENQRNADRNATSEQNNTRDNDTKKAEGYANRLHDAIMQNDSNNINRVRNSIEKFKADIDRQYKKGELTLKQADQLRKVLKDLSDISNNAGKTISQYTK